MNRKIRNAREDLLNILLSHICLLFFLFIQAAVSLRMILELLELVPGAFFGLSGVLMIFSGTVCLIVKLLLRISRQIDKDEAGDIRGYWMAIGGVVFLGMIYPAAMGFRDGMTALFYYKAMNLQILLPWAAGSMVILVQDR